jgi:hypothetical protein
MITRRFILAAVAVTAGASALPAPLAAEAAPASVPSAPLPAWMVGSDGEFDWQLIRASSAREAQYAWLCEQGHFVACDEVGDGAECVCEQCWLPSYKRVPALDDKETVTPADWLRADMGTCCSRCGYETFPQEGAQIVGDEAVCEDCMELSDWQAADPERHAEMLADAAEEDA